MFDILQEQIKTTTAVLSLSGQKLPKVDEKASPRARMGELFGVNLAVRRDLSKYMLLSLCSGAVSVKVAIYRLLLLVTRSA